MSGQQLRCLVVYESMFGNTHEIADAIGRGLAHLGEVRVVAVGDLDAEVLGSTDLLVVGGPTHVHGMTRPTSRKAAVEEANNDDDIDLDADAPGPGLREWMQSLDKVNDVASAAFDTRIDKPVLITGSAARGIAKRLKRLGYLEAVDPQSFFVDDSPGPLRLGETDRASTWGTQVGNELLRMYRQKPKAH